MVVMVASKVVDGCGGTVFTGRVDVRPPPLCRLIIELPHVRGVVLVDNVSLNCGLELSWHCWGTGTHRCERETAGVSELTQEDKMVHAWNMRTPS